MLGQQCTWIYDIFLNRKCKAKYFTLRCCIKQNSNDETSHWGVHKIVGSIKCFIGVHIKALDSDYCSFETMLFMPTLVDEYNRLDKTTVCVILSLGTIKIYMVKSGKMMVAG